MGHFIGSLGIILMAFIQYPGFPLTNLPTPLRDSLQGGMENLSVCALFLCVIPHHTFCSRLHRFFVGLAVTYAINLVLAIMAAFKAGERGQPTLLWVAKTFSVGGLAYDQLTQLPTLDESSKKASAKRGRK